MARVLFLSYDGMTDPLGQSQVLPYLIGLREKGHEIQLISFEKPSKASKQASIAALCQAAGIQWTPLRYHAKPPILSTLYDLRMMQRAAYAAHRRAPIDIVHCRSYIAALVGMQLQHRLGVRFIFDMRGFWADERVDGGLWPQSNILYRLIYRYFKRMEKRFLQRADGIVSLTHSAKQEIAQWPIHTVPITIIPCCADLAHFSRERVSAAQQAEWRQRLNLSESDFVVSYLGSIGTWYMLPEMLQWFATLLNRKPKAKFLFITQEPAETIYQGAQQAAIPIDSLRVQQAERLEVPTLLSLSQLNIFFIKPSFSKKASSPTKQAEVMAMGIPIICNANVGDTEAIVQQHHCGYVLPALTQNAYDESMQHIDALGQLSADAIRNAAHKVYALSQGVNQYHLLYTQLITQASQR